MEAQRLNGLPTDTQLMKNHHSNPCLTPKFILLPHTPVCSPHLPVKTPLSRAASGEIQPLLKLRVSGQNCTLWDVRQQTQTLQEELLRLEFWKPGERG